VLIVNIIVVTRFLFAHLQFFHVCMLYDTHKQVSTKVSK